MKRIRKLFILLLSCCLVAFLISCTKKDNKSKDSKPIAQKIYSGDETVIAVLAPLQGELKLEGENFKKGALVAESIINQKKKKIRLIIKDTRAEPDIASELAKDAIEKENAKILVGTLNEQSTLRVLNEVDTPFIYASNGHVKTCELENSQAVDKNIWGLGLSPQMITEPFLIHLSELNQKQQATLRLSYFIENQDFFIKESNYIQETAESFGFLTSGQEIVDSRIEDTFEKLQDIIAQNPDVLLVSASSKKTSNFLEQSSKLSIMPEIKIAGLTSLTEEKLNSDNTFKNGILTATTYTSDLKNTENALFIKKWKEMFPASPAPTATAARGFASITIAAKALEKANEKAFNELKFNKAMDDLEIKLPQGNVFISSKNHLTIQALYSSVFKNGQFEKLQFLGDISHPELEGCKRQEEQNDE